jgi:hypothetical protein
MVYASTTLADLDSLDEVLIFSLMFSQTLFMSSSSLKFSKATNLFVNSIWYCFLTSSSFSFVRLNLFPSHYCATCLITANPSLTLQPPGSDQYQSRLPWNFVHLVYSNAISYLSICDQSGCESYLERSRCTNECFGAGTSYTHLTRNYICGHIYENFIIRTHYYIVFCHFNNS